VNGNVAFTGGSVGVGTTLPLDSVHINGGGLRVTSAHYHAGRAGTVDLTAAIQDYRIIGGLALLACGPSGLFLFDVSQAAPSQKEKYQPNISAVAIGVAVGPNKELTAYVACGTAGVLRVKVDVNAGTMSAIDPPFAIDQAGPPAPCSGMVTISMWQAETACSF
jgi:hypothetical protein